MSVTILFSPSLSRLFLFQAGFSFYQVSQGYSRGSGVLVIVCAQLFSNRRLESVVCRREMYSGGTVLTAWKAILFWYDGDRFWIVVFSFLSFSSQAFLIQPDSVVRVCAFWGVRDHRERARARRDSFESSCVGFWSFQRVKLNGILFKGTQKSSA